jgi:hypothetical protein
MRDQITKAKNKNVTVQVWDTMSPINWLQD